MPVGPGGCPSPQFSRRSSPKEQKSSASLSEQALSAFGQSTGHSIEPGREPGLVTGGQPQGRGMQEDVMSHPLPPGTKWQDPGSD